jgi:hypothetical protein
MASVFAPVAPVPGEVAPPTAVLRDSLKGGEGTARFLQEQATLLASDPVLRAALRRPEVAELKAVKTQADPLRWLRTNVWTNVDAESGTLRIRLGVGSPREQAHIINAVVDSYLEEIVRQQRQPIEKRLENLYEARKTAAQSLAAIQRKAQNRPKHSDPEIEKMYQDHEQPVIRLEQSRLTSIERSIEDFGVELRRSRLLRIVPVEKARAE